MYLVVREHSSKDLLPGHVPKPVTLSLNLEHCQTQKEDAERRSHPRRDLRAGLWTRRIPDGFTTIIASLRPNTQ